MYRLIIAGIGVAAALFTLGCGGSGSDESTAQVSKALFVKQANAVCAEGKKKREVEIAAWEKNSPERSPGAHLDEGLKEVIGPGLTQVAEGLEALSAPNADAEKIDRMIKNLLEGSVGLAKKGLKASTDKEITEFKREAAAYGLKACTRL